MHVDHCRPLSLRQRVISERGSEQSADEARNDGGPGGTCLSSRAVYGAYYVGRLMPIGGGGRMPGALCGVLAALG